MMAIPVIVSAQVVQPPAAEKNVQQAGAIEEVVVTTRRREESLQQVPAAVQAITGATLAEAGIRKTTDIQALVPGLVFRSFGGNQPIISMRGSGNRLGGQITVGVFQDGIFLSNTQIAKGPIDLQRIEIAKGPQSTLYGRATMAGAINMITANPTDEYVASIDVGAGGSPVFNERLWHAKAILSGPLVGDRLLGRLVISREQRDGYVVDPVSGARGLSYDRSFARLKLLYRVNENLDVKFTGEILEDHPLHGASFFNQPAPTNQIPGAKLSGAGAFDYARNPIDFGNSIWDTRFTRQLNAKLFDQNFNLEVGWDTPIGTVTSMTNYSINHAYSETDLDGTQYNLITYRYPTHDTRSSQEFRLAGGERLKYLGGVYFLRTDAASDGSVVFGPGSTSWANNIAVQYTPSTTHLKSYSAFLQLGYDITDQINLTGGVRYGTDKLVATTNTQTFSPAGIRTILFGPFERGANFSAPQGNIVGTYHFAPDILSYASYSRGDRPGGLNSGTTAVAASTPYQPEQVDTFEVGFKATLFDRHLRTNIALFDNSYTNMQVSRNQAFGTLVINTTANAAQAKARGIDADFTVVINPQFRITAGYNHIKASITEFELTAASLATQNLKGQRILRTPKDSGTIGITYKNQVGPGDLDLGASYYFSGSYANDYLIPPTVGMPIQNGDTDAYHTVGLTASYSVGPWEVSAYVNNLLEAQYVAAAGNNYYNQLNYAFPGEPRTFEISLKRTFE